MEMECCLRHVKAQIMLSATLGLHCQPARIAMIYYLLSDAY